jgi:signal transduction histidine kinase
MLAQSARQKGIVIRTENSVKACHLLGDPTRLQQALLNYAANALKFTEHGHITLRVGEAARSQGSMTLRFEVEDTGIGIAADTLPNCSRPSSRPTTRPRAAMAAPGSAWRSPGKLPS